MAGSVNSNDVLFVADEDTKKMKEILFSKMSDEIAQDTITEIDLQRITNSDIEELLT